MSTQAKRVSMLSLVAIACILVCLATAVWPNINGSISDILFGVAFAAPLLAIPFIVLWFFGRRVQSKPIQAAFIFAMLAALLWWCFVFWETFLVPENSDAQAGLVFVFGPFYSSIAAVVLGSALRILDRRTKTDAHE